MRLHHISLRTADIFASIVFFEQLGFVVTERFQIEVVLACWLEGCGTRLELIQVPEPQPTPGYFSNNQYVGYQHLSFMVASVSETLHALGSVTVLLPPQEQQMGGQAFTVAFISSPDGLPIELISSDS